MPYALKTESFDATEAFNGRVAKANNTRDQMLKHWKAAYETFWMTPRTHGERAISMADLQAVINIDQALVGQMLTDSAAFLAFAQANYAEAFGDDQLVPLRYTSSPYDYTGTPGTDITLTALKTDWEDQNPSEE